MLNPTGSEVILSRYSNIQIRQNIGGKAMKMAGDISSIPELDQKKYDADEQVKIICLGDSAVGKSK